jgi:hypothetical protein
MRYDGGGEHAHLTRGVRMGMRVGMCNEERGMAWADTVDQGHGHVQ